MSIPQCGVCHEQESKYKCPICELRYCSSACYKSHKATHAEQETTVIQQQAAAKRDRPGTKQRVPKVDFTGFEKDAEFKRLWERYPLLKVQLQTVYGFTLEPGPAEKWSWNQGPLLPPPYSEAPSRRALKRALDKGGGGRWARGGRGGRGGGMGRGGPLNDSVPEERQRGQWTQEKGDREALLAMKKMRTGAEEDEKTEGMREFVELCLMRFGPERVSKMEEEKSA